MVDIDDLLLKACWDDQLPSLQIIFFYKPVVCQAKVKILLDIQSVWSDKNIFPHLFKKKFERMTCFSVIKFF